MKKLLAIGLFVILGACGGAAIVVDGTKVDQSDWEETKTRLSKRFEIDADCAEDPTFRLIEVGNYRKPTSVYVFGCGKRVSYVRVVTHNATGTWNANVLTQSDS